MVLQGDGAGHGHGVALHAVQQVLAEAGVLLDLGKFRVGQPARLVQDLRGDQQLAQIVHCGGEPQVLHGVLVKAHLLGQYAGVFGHPPDVLAGLLALVLGDLRQGNDDLFLDAVGLVCPILQVRAVFKDQRKEAHQ